MFVTSISPEEAGSKLAAWAKFLGWENPSQWLVGPGFGGNPFKNCRNTVYANAIYDNGGCKGCHGVAQTSFGTDFSFLLDVGNNKPSVFPAGINNPSNDLGPAAVPKPPQKHYLDGDFTGKGGGAR